MATSPPTRHQAAVYGHDCPLTAVATFSQSFPLMDNLHPSLPLVSDHTFDAEGPAEISRSPSSTIVVMPPKAFQRRLSSGNVQRSRSAPVVQSSPNILVVAVFLVR